MIERYTLPEMGKIWSLENEWRTILNVELAACDAMAELGEIPVEAAKNIRYMQICAGLTAAIISGSIYLLIEPVTFTDADIISGLISGK